MQRPKRTNEEILHNLRYSQEWYHRRCREYFSANETLILTPCLPNPPVRLEHIQDSCNKSTAVYSMTPHLEPHTMAYSKDSGNRSEIIHTIYEQWFCGHDVDIDFGNFVAKLISIRIPSDKQAITVEEIINIHKVWYDHVEYTLPLCSKRTSLTETEIEDHSYNDDHGPIGINQKQNRYYKLRPLFRALIIIVDHQTSQERTQRVVHLLRTKLSPELSAPISFKSIQPKLDQGMFPGYNSDNLVTTTLSSAIDFVMALELREHNAFPESHRDPSIVDERMGGSGTNTEIAQSGGYTGPEIRGPSTGWVKLAEGEKVIPPVTPLVLAQRSCLGLPPPRVAHRRRLIKKEN